MAEFKGKTGHWVTTESGAHIFIESNGSFDEAVEKAFGKENKGKYKKYDEEVKNKTFNDDEITDMLNDINDQDEDDEYTKLDYFNLLVKKGVPSNVAERAVDKYFGEEAFDNDNDFENWDDDDDDDKVNNNAD